MLGKAKRVIGCCLWWWCHRDTGEVRKKVLHKRGLPQMRAEKRGAYQIIGCQANVAEVGEGSRDHIKDIVPGRDVEGSDKDGDQVQSDHQADEEEGVCGNDVRADRAREVEPSKAQEALEPTVRHRWCGRCGVVKYTHVDIGGRDDHSAVAKPGAEIEPLLQKKGRFCGRRRWWRRMRRRRRKRGRVGEESGDKERNMARQEEQADGQQENRVASTQEK